MRLAVRRLGLAARPATREVRRKIGHRNYSTNPGATRITGSDGLPLAVPAPKPQPLLTGAAEAIVEAKEAILEESMEYIVRFGVFLKKHPLKANAMVSCGFCIVSDMLAQAVEWRQAVSSPEKVEYNYKRTARMAAWGFMIGPVISVWYRTLHIGTEAMQVSYAPVVRGRIAGLLERINPNWSPVLHLQRDRQHSPTALVLGKVVIDTCMFQLPLINGAALARPTRLHTFPFPLRRTNRCRHPSQPTSPLWASPRACLPIRSSRRLRTPFTAPGALGS